MFKKALGIFMLGILLTGLSACGNGNETPQPTEPEPVIETVIIEQVPEPPVEPEPELSLPGKIAIVTNVRDFLEEEYISARYIQEKFGEEYVIHRTWPIQLIEEAERAITILSEIASIPDVRVLIINQAFVNTSAAVETFRAIRDDVLIVYISPSSLGRSRTFPSIDGDYYDVITRNADLILDTNRPMIGYHLVNQAKAMGAETIVHYSFTRHMVWPHLAARRDAIREASGKLGIEFVNVEADELCQFTETRRLPRQFLMEDTPDKIEEHGKNTAFFATSCSNQLVLIQQILEHGAINVQICCPSPFHAFPTALGIAATQSEALEHFSPAEIIEAIKKEVAAAGATGRIATSPLSDAMLFTYTAVEYGIRWMRGEVSKDEIDLEVLSQIMVDVIAEQTGVEGLGVQLARHEFDGEVFPNFILVVQDYLTF